MNHSQRKIAMTEEIWLCYFNDVLFDKGIITAEEKHKMKNAIFSRCENKRRSVKVR